MATVVIRSMVDDVDGSEAAQTVLFGLDGVVYTIDLSDPNALRLRESLAEFLAAGTPCGKFQVTEKPQPAPGRAPRGDLDKIRTWARENGHEVSDRGAIKKSIISAYDEAHRPLAGHGGF